MVFRNVCCFRVFFFFMYEAIVLPDRPWLTRLPSATSEALQVTTLSNLTSVDYTWTTKPSYRKSIRDGTSWLLSVIYLKCHQLYPLGNHVVVTLQRHMGHSVGKL